MLDAASTLVFGGAIAAISASTVDVAPMIYGDDRHGPSLLVDFVGHSEVSAPSAALAGELKAQFATYALRVLRQGAVHELDTRHRRLLWDPIHPP